MRVTEKKLEALSMLPSILSDIREAIGLSQADIARMTGVSRQYVAKWENGQSTPSQEQLQCWLDGMNVEIRALRIIWEAIRQLKTNLSQLPLTSIEDSADHKSFANKSKVKGK